MKKAYPEKGFDDLAIQCPNCGWKGNGSETIIIDLYGLTRLKEVHCPSCDTYLTGLLRESRDHGNPDGDELSNQFG